MKFKHTYRRAADCVSAPEELTNTVLQIPKQTKPRGISRPLHLIAVAAVLALVIGILSFWPAGEQEYVTGPGLLAIRANASEVSEDIEEILLEEGIVLPATFEYRIDTNVAEVLPITLSIPADAYPNMDITFEVSTMDGIFLKAEPYDPNAPHNAPGATVLDMIVGTFYGQHFELPNNTSMEWTPAGLNYDYVVAELKKGVTFDQLQDEKINTYFSNNPSYMDIIIKADQKIVGYAVIEIREVNGVLGMWARDFAIEVLKVVSFPRVNGKLQKVSEEYVLSQINLVKANQE
jgi:hypothetical protein